MSAWEFDDFDDWDDDDDGPCEMDNGWFDDDEDMYPLEIGDDGSDQEQLGGQPVGDYGDIPF